MLPNAAKPQKSSLKTEGRYQAGVPHLRRARSALIVESKSGDNVAKFALAVGSLGIVRTRTARAWPEAEFQKLISELP